MNEKLSRLQDSEVEEAELAPLLDACRDGAELKSTWARYHAIGHVIRNGAAGRSDPDLWRRVSLAIEKEPVLLVPRAKPRAPWREHAFNFALAASLAAVGLIVGRSLLANSEQVLSSSPQTLAANPAASGKLDHSRGMASAQARFDDYLLVHNESAQLAGSGGLLPYARLASMRNR